MPMDAASEAAKRIAVMNHSGLQVEAVGRMRLVVWWQRHLSIFEMSVSQCSKEGRAYQFAAQQAAVVTKSPLA